MSNELNLRIGIEQAICRRVCNELICHGFHLIWDGGDEELEDLATTQSTKALCEGNDGMFNYDDGHLLVYKAPKKEGSPRKADAFVRIVFGNDGHDCISDYSTSLENKLANSLRLSKLCEDISVVAFAKAVVAMDMSDDSLSVDEMFADIEGTAHVS